MRSNEPGIKRRTFLKRSAVTGLGVLAGTRVAAARLVRVQRTADDSEQHRFGRPSPLCAQLRSTVRHLAAHDRAAGRRSDYAQKDYYGVLAESWKFEGNTWVFRLRKGIRFHDGSPFTAQDVIHSVNRIKNDKRSLQKSNFDDLTEITSPRRSHRRFHHGAAQRGSSRSITEPLYRQ